MKTIAFLGDSITEGVGASSPETNYVSLVGKKTGHEVINYGVSGTRIAKGASVNCIVTDKDVFVTEGVNLSGNNNMPFYIQKKRNV